MTQDTSWLGEIMSTVSLTNKAAEPYPSHQLDPCGIQILTSIGCFQTSTMDTAKVLPECFPVLEIVRMWEEAIKPNPGAVDCH